MTYFVLFIPAIAVCLHLSHKRFHCITHRFRVSVLFAVYFVLSLFRSVTYR